MPAITNTDQRGAARERTSKALSVISRACLLLALASCSPGGDKRKSAAIGPPPPTPVEHVTGEQLFVANCSKCHGQWARGTAVGPPLVHDFYRPGHHSDAAFILAVSNGVAAHHWNFGNMPAQPKITRDELTQMIEYVRWLQREAGIL
ncbi:MAG: cytochrome c [Gemmatimonadaceae bacterium]